MKQLTVEYPDDMEQVVNLSEPQLVAHIKLMATLKMFELGELSSGKAAEFADISRVEFIDACGRYGVSMYDTSTNSLIRELQSDLSAAAKSRL